jgi:adenine-specific DNA-methyltransferase
MALLRVHVFDTRDSAFEDDDVLQENVIFHAKKGGRRGKVLLSASDGPESEVRQRWVLHDEIVDPKDSSAFIHLAVSSGDKEAARRIAGLPCTLTDLGLRVSTGRVVEFRVREFLRKEPISRTVPLIYPAHFEAGFVAWPRSGGRKPNALEDRAETRPLMVEKGTYVLTKRFTSKEERRRVVAAVYEPRRLPKDFDHVGFENHVNYFHTNGVGLSPAIARGLAAFLNSSLADRYFRQFNGHTQVNASDLRSFRYPSLIQLGAMGRRVGATFPDQEGVDGIVEGALSPLPNDSAR